MSMNDTLQISFTNSSLSTISADKLIRKIILGCLLSSLSIFTVCGNILVLYAIQTEKYLRTVSNLFILSLAVADLAVGLFVMPLSAAIIIAGRWPFSSAICKLWLSIDYVASTASIFNLVLLSLDRYWAVVYPLRYLRSRTRRRATIFILTVWFIALLWAPAVIFWSYIAPQHSDRIPQNECDTSFRSNKTFKTLTALVNFYFPLLTMIIISCRIMIAIRSRSKMELGRRLSSATQKQMKSDRTHTISSLRYDNETTPKSNDTEVQPLTPAILTNPLDFSLPENHSISNNNNNNNSIDRNTLVSVIEPGQCFCSTCQNYGDNDNDSLWQLQQTKINKSSSSLLQERFSGGQMRCESMILTPKTYTKEDKKHKSQDLYQKTFDFEHPIKSSVSLSNNMKYSTAANSHHSSKKKLSPMLKKRSIIRTISSTSSTYSNEYSEPVFINPAEKQQKPKPKKNVIIQRLTPSKYALPVNSYLKVPAPPAKHSVMSINSYSSVNSSMKKSTRMNFFNILINPSRSNSLQKELKAARQLGMLVGVFTITWLPYFILFLVVAWCNSCISDTVFTASIWLGYLNSTVNPLIYPLCNTHFRRAFQKICYCKHAKTKLPNLNALLELQALHSMSRRR